ncbi:hypothetical protein ACQ4PT_003501 [Festuca glaucescens]
MDGLPEKLLAGILDRLPPRSLAACRIVCHDWCTAIDDRGMLLAVTHLLPHSMRGIYINFAGQYWPYFFCQEQLTNPGIDTSLDFMRLHPRWGGGLILDHRNGLLLYTNNSDTLYMCNPATWRWAELPTRPSGDRLGSEYLMFDPTVSLHYDVLFFQEPPLEHRPMNDDLERLFPNRPSFGVDWKHRRLPDRGLGSMAWPPVSYSVQVFSSRTGLWEEKRFVQEEHTPVTVSDIWSDPWGRRSYWLKYNVKRYHAVYSQEAFYTGREQVFATDSDERKKDIKPKVYLGKSQQGVYYAVLYENQLRVWVLHEVADSGGPPAWELKHQAMLESSFLRHYARRRVQASWNLDRCDWKGHTEYRRDHDWDSGDDSVADGEEEVGSITDCLKECANERSNLLGFHPHKEIIFFGKRFDGFAYYLRSCKFQYLGSILPTGCHRIQWEEAYGSFIYTPCMYDMLPLREKENDNNDEDAFYDANEDGNEEDDDDGGINWLRP